MDNVFIRCMVGSHEGGGSALVELIGRGRLRNEHKEVPTIREGRIVCFFLGKECRAIEIPGAVDNVLNISSCLNLLCFSRFSRFSLKVQP